MKNYTEELAPCELNCKTCVRSSTGPIITSAESLLKNLEGFASFAEKFSGVNPAYSNYREFEKFLTHLTKADCNGCRNGSECFSGCFAKKCHIENNVSYCFQCAEFPCSRNSFIVHRKSLSRISLDIIALSILNVIGSSTLRI